MKDYGYYKNIINQRYNPEKKVLTKEKFYELRNKILKGKKEYVEEFYQMISCYVYDQIAHAYAQNLFKIEFEDALQFAALQLHRMKIGEERTKYKNNYFSDLSTGLGYKKMMCEVTTKIFKGIKFLENKEDKFNTPFPYQSDKFDALLNKPEEVATTNINRVTLKNLIIENACTYEERKEIVGSLTISHIFENTSYDEIAKDYGISRQRVAATCKKNLENIKKSESKQYIKELLS